MGQKTIISWTNRTWNPWRGCTKISPGCKNCYMFTAQTRYGNDPAVVIRTKTWRDPYRWQREAEESDRQELVFTCSWSDWFHEDADAWRDEAWAVVRDCPNLVFQILTKRPDRIQQHLPDDWGSGYANVWLGVSIESNRYVCRAEILKSVAASVRFISAEPLLGPLPDLDLSNIDWLIVGREQSFVKHLILRNYLQRFAQIIGQRWLSITYVDCFAGPWQSNSDDLSDMSFGVAVSELRKARLSLSQTFQRNVKIRAFFLEEDKEAYKRLNAFAKQQSDMEIMTLNLRLEDAVSEIVRFIKSENDTFPFILIDPKGWSGFDIEVIKPLLKLRPGEVLVNFMIEHIRRFVEWDKETNKNSFVRLFGSESFLARIDGLQPSERDDVIAQTYLETLKSVGEFEFGSMAVVLHPEHDRRFFYLPYVTRNPKGIEVFKDAEQRTMPAMEQLRARASHRNEAELQRRHSSSCLGRKTAPIPPISKN